MTLKKESKTRDQSLCPENPEGRDHLRRFWDRMILVKEVLREIMLGSLQGQEG